MVIKNAKVFTKDNIFVDADIQFGEKIERIGAIERSADINAAGCYVIPGLVEIHAHGAVGQDASDGDVGGLRKMAKYLASNGITSFCATTMSLPEETLTDAMHVIRDYERDNDGAKCAGVHLEGPFLAAEKCGAQAPEYLVDPDIGMFERLNEACGGAVKIVAVAPELKGSEEFIIQTSKVCSVAVAHTAADYDTAMRAFESGASHVIHLYNCMRPFLHRAPGVVGAARDCGATVELISDGLHLHPSTIRASFAMFGERAIPVSDSVRCAGMPDGEYELGGQQVFVRDGKSTLADGTIAGSTINLMSALRNVVSFGVPLEKAVASVTSAPSKVIGMQDEIGSIEVGKCADFVVLDKDLNVVNVIIDGRVVE
ncbi:MAG: N-acetylglucosamine-6-phosphate deacetylase [Clostridia bacterium]|jgi:N-acetylglucosamine-6-phosphate deacetylase|nr:N-acetylglucosamine-6-phosphate deacetylase [Clostridia bacterium]MBT7121633.1 N-acetylglucosamine-6-phosphate deacetylase [Clostridia bacterium]